MLAIGCCIWHQTYECIAAISTVFLLFIFFPFCFAFRSPKTFCWRHTMFSNSKRVTMGRVQSTFRCCTFCIPKTLRCRLLDKWKKDDSENETVMLGIALHCTHNQCVKMWMIALSIQQMKNRFTWEKCHSVTRSGSSRLPYFRLHARTVK